MGWGIENRRKKEEKSLWGMKKGVSLHRQKSERYGGYHYKRRPRGNL